MIVKGFRETVLCNLQTRTGFWDQSLSTSVWHLQSRSATIVRRTLCLKVQRSPFQGKLCKASSKQPPCHLRWTAVLLSQGKD